LLSDGSHCNISKDALILAVHPGFRNAAVASAPAPSLNNPHRLAV
jgi:hypothetical protein